MEPKWILAPNKWLEPDSGLTPTERLVLLIICQSVDTETHRAHPGEERIMKRTGYKVRAVRRALRRMEELRVIRTWARSDSTGKRLTNEYEVLGYDRPQGQPANVAWPKRDSARGNRPQGPGEDAPPADTAPVAGEPRPLTTVGPAPEDTDTRPQGPVNVVVAVNVLTENGEDGTDDAAPPVVATTGTDDALPPHARRFEREFYGSAPPNHQADVRRQLLATLQDGVPFRRSHVKALDRGHLDAACAAVLVDPPREPNAAMVFLLIRLNESFGETKAARERAPFSRERARTRSETSGPMWIGDVVAKVAS